MPNIKLLVVSCKLFVYRVIKKASSYFSRNLQPTTHNLQPVSGFTLMELIIVVAILSILTAIVFISDITGSLKKARDNNRKQDLNKLTRILDDYYNDYQKYPPMNTPPDGQIAGNPWGSALNPYTTKLPRDPLFPNRWFYYQSEPNGTFFVIYAQLENTGDPDITLKGCQNGCGPYVASGQRLYNYIVTSNNVRITDGYPDGYDPGLDNILPGVTPGGVTIPAGPTATTAPAVPTPTINLTPPPVNGIACPHNTCCLYTMCGDELSTGNGGIGYYCTSHQRCMYNVNTGIWGCVNDCSCPYGCD